MLYKSFRVIGAIALLLTLSVSASAEEKVAAQKVEVTDTGERPLWRKIVRVTARVATLGLVQPAPVTVQVNKPFTVLFDHDGLDTDGYRLRVVGPTNLTFTVPVTTLVQGVGSFANVVLTARGNYSLTATAYNVDLESDPSLPLAVNAQNNKPKAPTNIRKQ